MKKNENFEIKKAKIFEGFLEVLAKQKRVFSYLQSVNEFNIVF